MKQHSDHDEALKARWAGEQDEKEFIATFTVCENPLTLLYHWSTMIGFNPVLPTALLDTL